MQSYEFMLHINKIIKDSPYQISSCGRGTHISFSISDKNILDSQLFQLHYREDESWSNPMPEDIRRTLQLTIIEWVCQKCHTNSMLNCVVLSKDGKHLRNQRYYLYDKFYEDVQTKYAAIWISTLTETELYSFEGELHLPTLIQELGEPTTEDYFQNHWLRGYHS